MHGPPGAYVKMHSGPSLLPAEIGRFTSNHCEDKMAPKDGWDSGIASTGNNSKRLKF